MATESVGVILSVIDAGVVRRAFIDSVGVAVRLSVGSAILTALREIVGVMERLIEADRPPNRSEIVGVTVRLMDTG